MKRLARWAARLYPAGWRARYGVEMEALLEDVGPGSGDLWDIVRGALFMRVTSLSFWKILAGCTLAGLLAAGVWTAILPQRYVSKAVLRIGGDPQSRDRLQAAQLATLSRSSLAEIIQRPSLNLYKNERHRIPMEDVIEEMRTRDLRIRQVNGTTLAMEFAGANPGTAQATSQALVDRLMELSAAGGGGGAPMEVLRPASLPPRPEGPDHLRVISSGLGAGLLLGLVSGAIWSIVRRKERWNFKRIGAFAAGGIALGLTVAFLIPDQFVSTAVLRTNDIGKLQSTIAEVLSDDSLAVIVRQDDLFSRELSNGNMSDVTRKMRNEFIRVQQVRAGPDDGALVLRFRYPDRWKAQAVTRDLVNRFFTGPQHANAEVLDPPNLPATPVYPNRLNIVLVATAGGLLLGLAVSRLRRPKLTAA
jgi:hypothetical protein